MPTVNVRELARNTAEVLDTVAATGRPMLVVRNGELVAALVPIESEALEDYVLGTAPQYLATLTAVDGEIEAGTLSGHLLEDVEEEMAVMALEAERRKVPYSVVVAEREAAEARQE